MLSIEEETKVKIRKISTQGRMPLDQESRFLWNLTSHACCKKFWAKFMHKVLQSHSDIQRRYHGCQVSPCKKISRLCLTNFNPPMGSSNKRWASEIKSRLWLQSVLKDWASDLSTSSWSSSFSLYSCQKCQHFVWTFCSIFSVINPCHF
jgi:hypothetical protein